MNLRCKIILTSDVDHLQQIYLADEEILSESDFYFKRSYDKKYVSLLAEKNRVFR